MDNTFFVKINAKLMILFLFIVIQEPSIDALQMKLQVNEEENLTGLHCYPKGENLTVKCQAFNLTGNVSSHWTIQRNTSKVTAKHHKHLGPSFKTSLSFPLYEDVIVTCHLRSDRLGSLQKSVNICISTVKLDEASMLHGNVNF